MTAAEAREFVTRMLDLLEEQATLARQLRQLAETQRQWVAAEDTSPLMTVLARRRDLTERLTQVSSRLVPARELWPTVQPLLPVEDRARVSALGDEVHAAVQAVLASDAEDASRLRLRRDQVSAGLKSTQQGKAMMHAYGQPVSGDSECLDTMHDEA